MRKKFNHSISTFIRICGVCLLLGLTGCEEKDVASGLDQVEANKIVAELHRAGIDANASTEVGGRGKFTVSVDQVMYQKAVSILDAKGLPDRDAASLRSMMSPSGLLPASRQIEAMRLDYALALQLASLLRSNAGIRDAKVVVRLNALAEGEKPSVSISLSQENPDALPDAEIEKMVRQIITGIEPGQYAITRSQAPVIDDHGLGLFHSVFGVRIFDEEYSRFVSLVLGGLFLFGVLGAALGFLGGYRRATRGDDQRADLPALWQGQQKEMLDVRRDGP